MTLALTKKKKKSLIPIVLNVKITTFLKDS